MDEQTRKTIRRKVMAHYGTEDNGDSLTLQEKKAILDSLKENSQKRERLNPSVELDPDIDPFR